MGGGGGSASPSNTGANQVAVATGGAGGGYCRKTFSATTIGASQSVTIGSGGAANLSGGNSAFGVLLTANGGGPGNNGGAGAGSSAVGAAGGTATGGDINIAGQSTNEVGTIWNSTGIITAVSPGGGSVLGLGGASSFWTSSTHTLYSGTGYGAGGGGSTINDNVSSITGGSGTAGVCIITEFISN